MYKKLNKKNKWSNHFALSKAFCCQKKDRELTIKLFAFDLDFELKKAKPTDNIEIIACFRNIGDAFNPKSRDFRPSLLKKYTYQIIKKKQK